MNNPTFSVCIIQKKYMSFSIFFKNRERKGFAESLNALAPGETKDGVNSVPSTITCWIHIYIHISQCTHTLKGTIYFCHSIIFESLT